MGDPRPNNGGGPVPPDDGDVGRRPGRDGLGGVPDLPPEWGIVVIPDDAAELAAEATALRRELRTDFWRRRARRLVGLGPRRRPDSPSLGVPLVIMTVALITTVLSLFVVTWDHRPNATAPVGPDNEAFAASVQIADIALADASGSRVRLGNLLPAVLLIVGDCDCAELIAVTARAVPPLVTLVPVAETAPCSVGPTKNVRCLADPAGIVTGQFAGPLEAIKQVAPPSDVASAGPTVGATGTPAAPAPVMLAVPVDADGMTLEPIAVDAAGDLAEAIAKLTGGN